jgi:hypothetical protein
MERREFLRRLSLGLAAGWVAARWSWPRPLAAAAPVWRLALLADAHLKNGKADRPEALALARAVAEIRALRPAPDLVLFLGDLAHKGRPDALDLGREILADLPGSLHMLRGEGDWGPGGEAPWRRRFGEPWFSRSCGEAQVIGLDTTLTRTRRGPIFEIGAAQLSRLARELAALSPETAIIIASHAPLARLFRPWQHWTGDSAAVAAQFARFPRVLCLHGHVHAAAGARVAMDGPLRRQGPGAARRTPWRPPAPAASCTAACPPPPGPAPWPCRAPRRSHAQVSAPMAAVGPCSPGTALRRSFSPGSGRPDPPNRPRAAVPAVAGARCAPDSILC